MILFIGCETDIQLDRIGTVFVFRHLLDGLSGTVGAQYEKGGCGAGRGTMKTVCQRLTKVIKQGGMTIDINDSG